ncbi:T9SS type A sorting domain-containing protein [candidate division TA06 bacterium]|nr:T9SS type A sorting domain-containing protein [candidate division TA06 bacterium]
MRRVIWVSFGFLVAIGSFVLPADGQPGGWIIDIVDTPGDVGQATSITLDGIGNPHISYYDAGNEDLKYATKNGSWTTETVESTGFTGESSSIEVDGSGNPHISYFDLSGSALKYAVGPGPWTIEVVDSFVIGFTSLALDASNNPHISYCVIDLLQPVDFGLRYANKNGAWTLENVDFSETNGVGQYTSIALNGGNPRISYYTAPGFGSKNLKYAAKNGSWTTENVETSGDVGRYSSLALDASGNPRISYYNFDTADLKYAAKNGSWTIQTADAAGMVGKHSSIGVDNSGDVHISYYDETNGNLLYAFYDGLAWAYDIVDNAGNVGQHSSLILDAAGNPHISYYDATLGDLKYAVGIPITAGLDGGVDIIFLPDTLLCAGDTVNILVQARNFGTTTLTNFDVNVTITPAAYNQTVMVDTLPPLTAVAVPFPPWVIDTLFPVTYTMASWTSVSGDTFTDNDTTYKNIEAINCAVNHDGAVLSLDSLPSVVCIDTTYSVCAFVTNQGDSVEPSVWVYCSINPAGYLDSVQLINLPVFFPTLVCFQPWMVPSPDSTNHLRTVWIDIPGDLDPSNDALSDTILAILCGVGVEEDIDPVKYPTSLVLNQNNPNPFHQATTITYGLPSPIPVSLKVYDITGRTVRVLVNGKEEAGIHTMIWDGRNSESARVGSGIYFYSLTAGDFSITKKMMLIR